jgi:hypothetical protein
VRDRFEVVHELRLNPEYCLQLGGIDHPGRIRKRDSAATVNSSCDGKNSMPGQIFLSMIAKISTTSVNRRKRATAKFVTGSRTEFITSARRALVAPISPNKTPPQRADIRLGYMRWVANAPNFAYGYMLEL